MLMVAFSALWLNSIASSANSAATWCNFREMVSEEIFILLRSALNLFNAAAKSFKSLFDGFGCFDGVPFVLMLDAPLLLIPVIEVRPADTFAEPEALTSVSMLSASFTLRFEVPEADNF